jgi:hypothetical protein
MQIERDDLLDFHVLMHFVQRKDIKVEWASVIVERRINVQENSMNSCSLTGVCRREVEAY